MMNDCHYYLANEVFPDWRIEINGLEFNPYPGSYTLACQEGSFRVVSNGTDMTTTLHMTPRGAAHSYSHDNVYVPP
mgnify:FL=1